MKLKLNKATELFFSQLIIIILALAPLQLKSQRSNQSPNVIIIFVDDMGYGDLGSYGHPSILTPNLDRMAEEGQRWTNFYVAANVCTPSRAGLLTGRLPIRSGTDSNRGPRVFFPNSAGGLPQSEITIAEMLKNNGYHTAAIGKWHLGHLPEFLPTSQGFNSYYGIPYSNDMDPTTDLTHGEANANPKVEYFNVPLMRDEKVVERPANQHTITKRYTEEAIKFIESNKDDPFFLYLAHNMPHVPLFASEDFLGTSKRGLYGDVVQELDWSVGEILNTLKKEDIDENTLVVFTSDNGPWTVLNQNGGSAGLLYGAKATSYEGGMRVPAIFWWPGKINPGVIMDIGSTLDLFQTVAEVTNSKIQDDREYDGFDLTPILLENKESPRQHLIYYHGTDIFAARSGNFKLYFYKNNPQGYPARVEKLEKLELYNIQEDPSERFNIIDQHPEIAGQIKEFVSEHKATVKEGEDQMVKKL